MSQARMSPILAVDGGGTGCRVAVADGDGAILARGQGGPANIASDPDQTYRNIMDAVHRAATAAGLNDTDLACATGVLGLAGVNVGDNGARLAARLPFLRSRVTDDRETTLQGALRGGDGCIASVGTGSFYCSRIDGVEKSIGGWGFVVGDDGSGARLGQDMLRQVLHCHDGLAAHSDLTRDILRRFDDGAAGIAAFSIAARPGEFADFARPVIDAARVRDPNALSLVAAATDAVQASIDCTGFTGHQPLCMLGGLGPVYLGFMAARYRDSAVPPKGDALDGAIAMALKFAGESRCR